MNKTTNIEPKTKEKEVAVTEKAHRLAHALTPYEEMDRLFDHLFEGFGPRWMRPWMGGWPWGVEAEEKTAFRMPHVDVIDREEAVVVRAELPGVEKKDLEVSLTEQTLTIRATTRAEHREEKGDYHRSEIRQGEFMRTLTLPAEVDGEKVKATFKDGLLELTLPKVAVTKRRTIAVE